LPAVGRTSLNTLMKNICYLPWVGVDISPQGEFKPCCKYKNTIADTLDDYLSSRELSNLQQDFLNNQQSPGCQRCWDDESAGIPSKRQLDWQYIFQERKPKLDRLAVLSFPFGNSCNLACRICGSYSSSTWSVEAKKLLPIFPDTPIFKHQRFYKDKSFIENIKSLCGELLHVEFPGGEPFINGIKEQLDFLDFLIDNGSENISLHYITNVTKFPEQAFWDRWQHFKKVDIQLSIDGTDQQFEYNRWPAKWTPVLKHIRHYQKKAQLNSWLQLSISHSVSIFTVYYLPEFLTWCREMELPKPYLGMVSSPKYYNVKALPKEIKDKVKQKLASFNLENVVKYMNSEDLSADFKIAQQLIKTLDQQRDQDFNTVFDKFL
jgi:organic radical activating enzyme